MARRHPLALLALAIGSVACSGEDRASGPLRHDQRMAVWDETLPADQIASKVGFAAAQHLSLNVAVVRAETDAAYLRQLCDEASRNDVALRLWPVISMQDGYWPNQANADVFSAFVDELLAETATSCPRLDGIQIDMEMPIARVQMLAAMRASGASIVDIATWILGGIDEAAFEAARGEYRALVARIHARGLRAYCTTLPMNADDWDDDDESVAMALWTPIDGIDWDSVSFQVYRSLFDQQFPAESGAAYTSGLVTTYARSIVARYGARGGVDLGTTGAGIGIATGLASAQEMQSDVAAALAAGIPAGHVALYSLEGLDDKPDAPAWVAVPAPREAAPTMDDEGARSTFRLLDSAHTPSGG